MIRCRATSGRVQLPWEGLQRGTINDSRWVVGIFNDETVRVDSAVRDRGSRGEEDGLADDRGVASSGEGLVHLVRVLPHSSTPYHRVVRGRVNAGLHVGEKELRADLQVHHGESIECEREAHEFVVLGEGVVRYIGRRRTILVLSVRGDQNVADNSGCASRGDGSQVNFLLQVGRGVDSELDSNGHAHVVLLGETGGRRELHCVFARLEDIEQRSIHAGERRSVSVEQLYAGGVVVSRGYFALHHNGVNTDDGLL